MHFILACPSQLQVDQGCIELDRFTPIHFQYYLKVIAHWRTCYSNNKIVYTLISIK